MVIRQSETIVH